MDLTPFWRRQTARTELWKCKNAWKIERYVQRKQKSCTVKELKSHVKKLLTTKKGAKTKPSM
jgi:hypothetical protein